MFKTILLFVIAVTGVNASCPTCTSGRTCPSTGGSCVTCSAGKFRASGGGNTPANTQCLDCPTGFGGTNGGGNSCLTCTQGKYQAELGNAQFYAVPC